MLIDCHAHLHMKEFDQDRDEVIERARKAGVVSIINSGTEYETNLQTLKLAEKYDIVHASLGIYPTYAEKLSEEDFQKNMDFIKKNRSKIISIGEVGLDYHHTADEALKRLQKKRFHAILEEMGKLGKPFVLHTRKAEKDVVDILESTTLKRVNFHCFTGNFRLVRRIADNKWYFSIPPTVIKMLHFQKLVEEVSLSQILTETDSPYLAPPSQERNEPAFVAQTVEKIAEIKDVAAGEAKKIIFMNYQKLFLGQ